MARRPLSLPVLAVSQEAKNAVPYDATIWDRLSPEERRLINRIRDEGGKK